MRGAMHALIGTDQPAGALIGQVGVAQKGPAIEEIPAEVANGPLHFALGLRPEGATRADRSEEHTSELQSQSNLVCRLLLEKKKKTIKHQSSTYTIESRYV